ncbi:MAG: hypothetical protein ACRCZY_10920 [Phocaeicola sp.]
MNKYTTYKDSGIKWIGKILEHWSLQRFTHYFSFGKSLSIIMDPAKTKVGYELSFTKYFYKPVELRKLAEIKTDLTDIQNNAEALRKLIMM